MVRIKLVCLIIAVSSRREVNFLIGNACSCSICWVNGCMGWLVWAWVPADSLIYGRVNLVVYLCIMCLVMGD